MIKTKLVIGFGAVAVAGSAILLYGPIGLLSQKPVTPTSLPVATTGGTSSDESTSESPAPAPEPSPEQAYEWVNTQVTSGTSANFPRYRRTATATPVVATTASTTTTTTTDQTTDSTPPPAPVYYDVIRTGAYKYTPAEVEAGVLATNPSYFTRTGNNFYTITKSGSYGGGFPGIPGDYFYLNELYYQININSSLTYLNAGTHLKYKNQDINFYVNGVLAIKWVLVEDLSNPGVDFYVTKQYELPSQYLWHTGAYGQVQGGPYIFDPVDIAPPFVCAGC